MRDRAESAPRLRHPREFSAESDWGVGDWESRVWMGGDLGELGGGGGDRGRGGRSD